MFTQFLGLLTNKLFDHCSEANQLVLIQIFVSLIIEYKYFDE